MARFMPIWRGSRCTPPASAARPTRGSGSAKVAFSDAMMRSQASAISKPPPIATPLTAAERWAETICKNSPMSIRASKQAIQKGLSVSLEQAISEQRDYPAVKAMAASQDYIEGPKAFSEKRAPKWLGK